MSAEVSDKPRFAKIVDNERLLRDTKTNAVLNTDLTALERYKIRREKDRQKEQELETLKNDVSEIKQLLQQLVNRD
jgi:hypothetical protein